MQPLLRQLELARRRTRLLLVLMRVSAFLAAVIAVMLGLGLLDYTMRMPGWMRAMWIAVGLFAGGSFARKFIGRAVRVNPSLPALALRLERLYPTAAGRLASAVAFASLPMSESPVTAHLTSRATVEAEVAVRKDQIRDMIDPRPCFRAIAMLVVAVGAMAGTALASPESFDIAVRRWVAPFGDARWPNRTAVESLTRKLTAPNNAPLPVAARVTQGDKEKLRTWVVYRFTKEGVPEGEWQRTLMTRQTAAAQAGVYERLLAPQNSADAIELYFQAGDDQTDTQIVRLIQPPTLVALTAEVSPPAYAAGLLPVDRHTLLQPPRPAVTVDALEGSRVKLLLAVQGSLKLPESGGDVTQLRDWLDAALPGMLADLDAVKFAALAPAYRLLEPADSAAQLELSFTLNRPLQFRFRLSDAYGTSYDDPRLFRFEVRADRSPRAAVTAPAADPMVLPTATVALAAEANDDVAVQKLELVARPTKQAPITLGTEEPKAARAAVTTDFDLTPLKLKPGDEVTLVAVARDNFNLDGRLHDPVESPPRTLRIIGEEELSRQIRTDLAELRQRALRAEAEQQQLMQAPLSTPTTQQQQDLTGRLDAMERSVAQVQERLERNRLNDDALRDMLKQSDELLKQAEKSSQQASQQLSAAASSPPASPQAQQQTQQARGQQEQTAQKLDELAKLLDQGRDAYELKQKLVKLSKDQQALSDAVRQTMPRTQGRELDQLPAEEKQKLADTAKQQKELGEEAKQLLERMTSTASALARQSEEAGDQAVAEAMRQAAETGTKQSLEQKMQQAAQQTAQNQLSNAQQQQQQAQQAIAEMLEQLDRAEQLKQDILRRKLAELVDAIRALRDSQKAQLDRLLAAIKFDDLDAPMITLQRNTLAVADQARRTSPEAAPVAAKLDDAAKHQSDAASELRATPVDKDVTEVAEKSSLTALEEALKLAEELQAKAENDQTEDERRKIVEKYKQILESQKTVRAETEKFSQTPEADRTRRWKADVVKLGGQQKALGDNLGELSEKLQETIIYKSVHEQIARWVERSTADLNLAAPSAATVFQQDLTISSLEALIEALGEDKPDEQFAEDQGGGGGGQQGGGKQPLIPPLAELKLLRARQSAVHDTTRAMEKVTDASVKPTIIQELSRQQEKLATSGSELLEQLQQPGP